MKKSGYHTTLHLYIICFLSLLGTLLVATGLFLLLVTVQKPDGTVVKSDWAGTFTEDFKEQIVFTDNTPQVTQAGLKQLQDYHIGLQIIDATGNQIYSFQTPEHADTHYSIADLLHLDQTGDLDAEEGTCFVGTFANGETDYTYIVHFPMEIKKLTMYLNGNRFTGGKTVVLSTLGILIFVILVAGVTYGFWVTRNISRLSASIGEISRRSYLPLKNDGAFGDLYGSLNSLDMELKESDRLRKETDRLRREWIANITHDLKTPLSPIRGYSELLLDDTGITGEQRRRYAETMFKNAVYMETLLDDLKLTYQLESDVVPVDRQEQNLIRFLRELTIDILNRPEYECRQIHFKSTDETILLSFDSKLLTRAFQNLILNAFIHGDSNTEITIDIGNSEHAVSITVADNGNGMDEEQTKRLFERYYRGTDTEQTPEGSGLGLAIVKNIVELHRGTISVSSVPGIETIFLISLPRN